MEDCPWCFKTLDDWNRLLDDLRLWYGDDKVVLLSVNGPNNKDLKKPFNVSSYP